MKHRERAAASLKGILNAKETPNSKFQVSNLKLKRRQYLPLELEPWSETDSLANR
jgi:hypothetical protein